MQFFLKYVTCYLLIPIFLANFSTVSGQIHYSHRFTKKLKKAHLNFIEPVEGFYKIRLPKKDEYLKYDLVLSSEEKAFEMRFHIDPAPTIAFPHMACFNLANSLATNDQHFNLEMQIFEQKNAHELFTADWAAYVDFIPKRSLTDKNYARLLTLYREEYGLAHLLLLFDHHGREKDLRLYTLSFVDDSAGVK